MARRRGQGWAAATVDFETELRRALKEIGVDVEAELDAILEEAGNTLVAELRDKSPKATGDYASGWIMEKERSIWGTRRIIKNELKPSLAHLLEYGHDGVNGIQHIKPSLENTIYKMEQKLKGGR